MKFSRLRARTVLRVALAVLVVGALVGIGFAIGSFARIGSNSLWIPVIAALGASFLTGVAGFGLELIRDALGKEHDEWRRRRDAYVAFLIAAASMLAMLSSLREIRKLATGAFRFTNFIKDPIAFLRDYNREVIVLFDAWTKVWLDGSQEAIEMANRFVDAAIPATEAASAAGKARPLILTRLLGEAWTTEQDKEHGEALSALGRLRIDFAKVARKELGQMEIDLLVGLPKRDVASKPSARPDA